MINAEVILWSRLRWDAMRELRFRRQRPIGPYVADFACVSLKLVVEVDGETHQTAVELTHDARRRAYFIERGWQEVRIANTDAYERFDDVLETIWRQIPPPRRPD